jgi:hypothetical protein
VGWLCWAGWADLAEMVACVPPCCLVLNSIGFKVLGLEFRVYGLGFGFKA